MYKVIERIDINEFTYSLGYNLWNNKVHPILDIYKHNEYLCQCSFSGEYTYGIKPHRPFSFSFSNSKYHGSFFTIETIFNKLRKKVNIPNEIENKYTSIFLLYKLNNFKKF